MYAHSKIQGELRVMESRIRHWVSLRQTFIMIPDLLSLMDPIMFHQPINSYMENVTAKDAGRVMIRCLDIPGDSEFWRQCYNISGGPGCRTVFLEFLDRIYSMLGMDYRKVMERKWFALKNFHMQFFEDADRLNDWLHHWDEAQSMEDFYEEVQQALPFYMKWMARMNRNLPPVRWLIQRITHRQLSVLANKPPDGTMHWIRNNVNDRIRAFYGSMEAYNNIPGWEQGLPPMDQQAEYIRLDHGFDEKKEKLALADLQAAAEFRGGKLIAGTWNGDLHQSLEWQCCQDHSFRLSPFSVLKAGHWCVECIGPPWNYEKITEKSPFFRQIYY